METPPSPNTVPLLSTQNVPRPLTIRAHPRSSRRADKTTVIIRYVCASCGQLLGRPWPRPITGSRSSGATRNFGWEYLRNVTQVPRAQLNSSQLRRRRHTANIALVAALGHRFVELGTYVHLIHTPRYRNRCLDVTVSSKQSSPSPIVSPLSADPTLHPRTHLSSSVPQIAPVRRRPPIGCVRAPPCHTKSGALRLHQRNGHESRLAMRDL
jgi:hypothetical protein